jgi:hypothetical protein
MRAEPNKKNKKLIYPLVERGRPKYSKEKNNSKTTTKTLKPLTS